MRKSKKKWDWNVEIGPLKWVGNKNGIKFLISERGSDASKFWVKIIFNNSISSWVVKCRMLSYIQGVLFRSYTTERLHFTSLLFTAICKASADSHFAFLHFFSLGMVLIRASCTMSWTSVHSSSDALSDLIPWIYLSLPLYNHLSHSQLPVLFLLTI